MYKTLENLAVLPSSSDFFSYTGNVLLVFLRMKQKAGPLEHQYGKNKSHAIARKFRNHKNKMEFKPRRAGYTMFVQEYYTFRSLTSRHFLTSLLLPKDLTPEALFDIS
jgi:hypothetical protein